MIELDHLTLTIEQRSQSLPIIGGVTITIADGESVVFVGPSGCGKTTMLRAVNGLASVGHLGGSIRVDGVEVRRPTGACAMVFQEFNLFPWRTVAENVTFGLEMLGMHPVERRHRTEQFMELVQLHDFADAYPHQISGGMKQRVGLARALATGAPHLLMDEPFGALDPQVRQLMQENLLRIRAADRRTLMFVTHDVDEAIVLADRVVVLSARPCVVTDEVVVGFQYPRDLDAIRATPEFAELRARIWGQLRGEVHAA